MLKTWAIKARKEAQKGYCNLVKVIESVNSSDEIRSVLYSMIFASYTIV